jgi:hypothetical protein
MAAVFVNLGGGDIFKRKAGSGSAIVSVPALDSMMQSSMLAIYTEVSVQLGETIQYFLTFDDVIKYIHFGKGLGNITVGGMLFSDCSGNLPGMSSFFSSFSSLRGVKTDITLGGKAFTCVVTAANLTITGEPDTTAMFQLVFSVVNHTL